MLTRHEMDVRNQFNEEDENRCLEEEEEFRAGNARATLTSFDLESASVTGSREGSIVSGVTVTTMVRISVIIIWIRCTSRFNAGSRIIQIP